MSVSASALAVSAAALRVASLDLCADEYLLLLARPGQIVSLSNVGRDPRDSVMASQARRYPANDGSVESLLTVRPNLLITTGGGGRSTQLLAGRLGMRTLVLSYASSIDDVAANMAKVSIALGNPGAADEWTNRLRSLRRTRPPLREAIYVAGGGLSMSTHSIGAEWMALAGLHQRLLPGARVTLEQLAVRPPPVLLLSRYRPGQASIGQQWLAHPIVARTRSQKLVADGRRWTCAGPLMLDEVERLRRPR